MDPNNPVDQFYHTFDIDEWYDQQINSPEMWASLGAGETPTADGGPDSGPVNVQELFGSEWLDLLGFDATPDVPNTGSLSNTGANSQPFNEYYGSSSTINSEISAASSVPAAQMPPYSMPLPMSSMPSPPPLPTNVTHPTFNVLYPVWSILLPAIFDTATTIALQTQNLGWLPDRHSETISQLNFAARTAAEALVSSYIADYPSFVPPEDIEHHLSALYEWTVDAILQFHASFRRSGRHWVVGYGFADYLPQSMNLGLYTTLTSHSSYLHLRSSPNSPFYYHAAFSNPVVMKIFRSRIYSDEDSLARRMQVHIGNFPSLQGLLPTYDLLWKRGGTINTFIHSVMGTRHGIHEWRRGTVHHTIWNMNDRLRFERVRLRIANGEGDRHIIENICSVLARRWYEKEDFAAPGTTGPDDGHESASSDESY